MIWPFKRRKTKKASVTLSFDSKQSREVMALMSKRYPALDRHFELTEQLRNTYTPSSEKAVERGILICREMISISGDAKAAWLQQDKDREKASKLRGEKTYKSWPLPNHLGYKQLAIILEKRGQLGEAINISRQAQAQGWNGDWEKRIARCESKLARQQK